MGLFIRIIMAVTIVVILILDAGAFLLSEGHNMERCKASLTKQGFSYEKVQEGCQFPQDIVDSRYIIYSISAVLIVAAAIIFITKGD